jgi:peptidoglycan hydrolase-like protein with peptidoglycan-binding domain
MNGTSSVNSAQADPSRLSKDQIKAVQQALNVKDDGVWGAQSQSALKQWQQQNGLPATGQLDQQTKEKLNVPG